MSYNYNHIITFLISRGWEESGESNLFRLFIPPKYLELPESYFLEIPKDSQSEGFDNYIKLLITIIIDLYSSEYNLDDLTSFFISKSSILSFRIADEDTKNGSIKFERFSHSIDSFKKIFSQITTFVSSKKPIFGNADYEVESFLHHCRTLQTEKGSFVTKFEISPEPILTIYDTLKPEDINQRLLDVLDFINYEVFKNPLKKTIDKSYIEGNLAYINVELFAAIRDLYTKAKINNAEFHLNNYYSRKYIETIGVLTKMKSFNSYIHDIKQILLDLVPLEAIGIVKQLSSVAPQTSTKNEVIIEATVANKTEIIKAILESHTYIEAIEAHKNEYKVRIKGYAKEGKTMYSIKKLESFEILQ
jgi:hypothetical protein